MEAIFLKLLNMSITAGWLVLAIIILRLLLKKAPKSIVVVMWALVGIRLICPFSLESVLSLIPSVETIPADIIYSDVPTIQSGIPILNTTVNPIISESLAPDVGESVNPMQVITFVASAVWIAGMAVMLLYTVVSYLRIHRKVREAAWLQENIWLCDYIDTPFIFGVIRPQIYLPSNMDNQDMKYVIAHEKAHLKRHDHWWKPLGFLLLTVYWFNPLLWMAYVLLCRDIELACDERVIRDMGVAIKKSYSKALINCSVPRKMIAACPLAFGEVGVKSRIKSVLSYKKPAFWIIIAAVIACVIVAVCFLTNPVDDKKENEEKHYITNPTNGITWAYTPVASATWHSFFYFEFDMEYTHVEAKCSTGELMVLRSYDHAQEIDNGLRIEAGENMLWYPYDDKIDGMVASESDIIFTVYNDDEEIHSGTIRIKQTSETEISKIYEAQLIDCDGLYLHQNTGNGGGIITEQPFLADREIDEPANVANEDIAALKEKYPQYFGLDTSKGLEVYVWQFAENSYSCGLLPGRNRDYSNEELWGLKSATMDEMRAIVQSYNIPKSDVVICPLGHPASSYLYTIDEDYAEKLEKMFWGGILYSIQSNLTKT